MRENKIIPVEVRLLSVDIEVQRTLNQSRTEVMAATFKEEALGVITASDRGLGGLFILDGQHRVAAAKIARGDGFVLACRVFYELTRPEEAELFRLLNLTQKARALESFRIAVVEGQEYAVRIEEMLLRYGLHTGLGVGTRFDAVVAARTIYERDPMALERTFITTTKAWGTEDKAAFENNMIRGMGKVFVRYGDALVAEDLIEKLQKLGAPGTLLGKGNDLRSSLGMRIDNAIAEVIVELYNKGRRTRSLPAWRS